MGSESGSPKPWKMDLSFLSETQDCVQAVSNSVSSRSSLRHEEGILDGVESGAIPLPSSFKRPSEKPLVINEQMYWDWKIIPSCKQEEPEKPLKKTDRKTEKEKKPSFVVPSQTQPKADRVVDLTEENRIVADKFGKIRFFNTFGNPSQKKKIKRRNQKTEPISFVSIYPRKEVRC